MRRSGFTLIELLVVVGILLVLATTTVMLINTTLDSDRGRSASRILQSALAGARDRALYTSRSPQGARNVGVRLIVENPLGADGQPGVAGTDDDGDGLADNRTEVGTPGTDDEYWVTKLVYVEQIPPWDQGTAEVEIFDPAIWGNPTYQPYLVSKGYAQTDVRVLYGTGTNWRSLLTKGLLVDGSEVRLPNDPTGTVYTLDTYFVQRNVTDSIGREMLILTTPYSLAAGLLSSYSLRLEPAVAPNSEPIELPRNIVIDLWRSGLRDVLRTRVDRIDIMYTPRGQLAGPLQSMGFAHFAMRDMEDVSVERSLANAQREQFVVSVNGSTGNVVTGAVNQTDADQDGRADDPWSFVIAGEVAGQ